MSEWSRPAPRRVRAIRDRLRTMYGRPVAPPHGRPLDELVLTVLSQSTNDRNRDVAYLRLTRALPTWEAVRDAPVAVVEEAIRPGGISKVKSARIQAILRAIGRAHAAAAGQDGETGGDDDGRGSVLSLDDLATMPVPEAQRALCALPGVGRKTAACVLCFAFGMHDIPVDTHVSRVGTRLHLFRPKAGFEEMHDTMLALTPVGQALELHVNLLRHGRRTCHARVPDCRTCALRRMCPERRV